MRENVIETIKKEKLIAIVRGIAPEKCLKVAGALYAGGFRLVEITFDQKNPDSWATTAAAIKAISEAYSGTMEVGAGTVTSVELVELAASAGAKYIISPDTNIDVIKRTRELGLVSMPGALTPTEILTAYNNGADFVKLFPIANLGPAYVKAVRADQPRPHDGGRRRKRDESPGVSRPRHVRRGHRRKSGQQKMG